MSNEKITQVKIFAIPLTTYSNSVDNITDSEGILKASLNRGERQFGWGFNPHLIGDHLMTKAR